MTEIEWMTSNDPSELRTLLVERGLWEDERKRLAFVAACRAADKLPYEYTVPLTIGGLAVGHRDGAYGWTTRDELSHIPPNMTDRAAILRDIFGNPFRRYAWTSIHDCSPSGHDLQFLDNRWLTWRDRTIPKLAAAIHDEQRFEDMPILADALEEAGCTDAALLEHCRGEEKCSRCHGSMKVDRRVEYATVKNGQRSGYMRRTKCECGTGTRPITHCKDCWVLGLLMGGEQ